MAPQASLSTFPARVRAAWRAHLAAAGQRPGQRARLLRHQAEVLPRFAAAYTQLQALPRPQRRRVFRRLKQSLASLALLLALGQVPVMAATIQVNGTCTLADAITAANFDTATGGCPAGSGADTIVLPANSTIILTAAQDSDQTGDVGLPVVTSALTIEGNGATIRRDSSALAFHILGVAGTGDLTLKQTTISGGEGFRGGGIFNSGRLTLIDSTVSDNTAPEGGGIRNDRMATLINSTVSGNTATSAAGYGGGGGISNQGTLAQITLTNSTVSGNSSAAHGGGIDNVSGAFILNNSTISGNTAPKGGGIFNSCDSYSFSCATLARSLVSGNTAPNGPEIADQSYSSYNSPPNGNNFNLIGHDGNAGSVHFTPSGSDIVPSQPLADILAPLAHNGGPTQTHALVPGSPAVDVIPATDPACIGTDQRGVARPQGPSCDIGAFELEAGFTFSGFFAPVANDTVNVLKAGRAVPVKFSLGGNLGLSILAANSPQAPAVPCTPGAPTDTIAEVVNAGNSSLSYDPITDTYTYVWKTDKAWANTCRQLVLTLIDGSHHQALFKFTK